MRRKYNIGDKFGQLTILNNDIEVTKRKYYVLCKCDCGKEKIINKYELGKGIISCGCKSKEFLIKMNTKHNLCNHRLHSIWTNMKQRCNNPKAINYKNYGGRGIKICKEWNEFIVFYNWATNNGYEEILTLDRINVEGDYDPDNCTWSNNKTQSRNRRNNKELTINGETKLLCEWAEISGISAQTIKYRYKKGMRTENILNKNF